jgi:hypothetical protein
VPVPGRSESAGRMADPSLLVNRTRDEFKGAKLPNRSTAETTKLNGTPIVADGVVAVMANLLVAAACTTIAAEFPVITIFALSVAVIVGLKEFPVWSVAVNVPTPLLNRESAGRLPNGSLVTKWTLPP